MAASSLLLLHKPISSFNFDRSSVPAYYNSRFPSLRLNFPLIRKRIMADSVKTQAMRDGTVNNNKERSQTLEQEAFINSSSELQNNGGGIDIEVVANRLSKWIVAALFGSVLLLRHDGAALWAVFGSVLNSVLSVVLKGLFNQERPASALRTDPGMPSSHAQSISFISVFTVFSIIEWLGISALSLFLSGLILTLGSYFTWLRVSQKLHTTRQVVVGAIFGSVYSTLWYITWNSLGGHEAFAASFSVQIAVFIAAAASVLGFAVYVLLNWFKDDR